MTTTGRELTFDEWCEIALIDGHEQAERCRAGACTCTHRLPEPGEPVAGGPAPLIDLRCPDDMAKLLGRASAQPTFRDHGVIELACGNCSRTYRRAGLACSRVVHRFNLLGELLTTEVTP